MQPGVFPGRCRAVEGEVMRRNRLHPDPGPQVRRPDVGADFVFSSRMVQRPAVRLERAGIADPASESDLDHSSGDTACVSVSLGRVSQEGGTIMASELSDFLYRLAEDSTLLSRYKADPDQVLDQTNMSGHDRALLKSGNADEIRAELEARGDPPPIIVNG
jgi:hypothetical protein